MWWKLSNMLPGRCKAPPPHGWATGGPGRRRPRRLGREPLEGRLVLAVGPAVISEFLAANDTGLTDGDGDRSDWIEIHNPTDTRVYLDGWHLTDDAGDLTKWRFPDVRLEPHAYLIVFASGKYPDGPAGELHTDFRLDADGEYLALVQPDGVTTAHQFAPGYPQQRNDVSYGTSQDAASFALEGSGLTYRVPLSTDDGLGTTWTGPGFDDSSWSRYVEPPQVLISEAGPGDPDFVEVQNLAGEPVDTSGWLVAVNDAYDIGQPVDVNAVHPTLWHLPAWMPQDEIIYRSDINDGSGNYWGENIFWRSSGPGWALLMDGQGRVADFVVWGYGTEQLAGLDVTVDGHRVTAGKIWNGQPIPPNLGTLYSLQRGGTSDHNDLSDFSSMMPPTMGAQNDVLTVPFGGLEAPPMGFETDPPGVGPIVRIDLQADMQHVNASLWARIPFQVDEGSVLDSLQLHIKYNDGFVAYLGGREVARRNAPDVLHWNSHATTARSVEDSLAFEEIDLGRHLDVLQPGANVLAVQGLNVSADDGNFLLSAELAATSLRYFDSPTPGGPNGSGFRGFVGDTQFSVDRGFYQQPFQLQITSRTPGATIYYTLDGSPPYLAFDDTDPTPTNGLQYTRPLAIDRTTTLRAAAFHEGFRPSNVDTQTYVFLDDAIHQPSNPTGFPGSWNGTAADYAMDSRVVNDPRYRDLMLDSLLSLPSMSIVTELDNLFGSSGIYSHPQNQGVAWERPTSIELINPDGTPGFQVDAGLRIYGGAFRGMGLTRKKTFRLLFKEEYGPTKLEFPLFDAPDAATSFDTIILRAGANDAWNNWGDADTQYIVDEFMRRTQLALGEPSGHGTFVHLYVNGLYWGLYNPVERPQASFAANYFGGDKQQWDALNSGQPTGGGNTATFNAMLNQVRSGLSDMASYQRIQGNNPDGTNNPAYDDLLDVDNYIDYMFSNFWGGTGDWPHHNWYGACRRPPEATGFKFFNWDSEGALLVWSDLNANRTGVSGGAAEPYQALRQNAEFRQLFGDHAHRHLFHNGPATAAESYARYQQLADQVEMAIIAESARWGDQRGGTPYTLAHWLSTRDRTLNNYMPQRSAIVLQQLRSAGLYPSVVAPTFNQHGGQVPQDFNLTITGPGGTIYYTLDGSDPRVLGGGVLPGARVFTGNPVVLSLSTLVKARVKSGDNWSALCQAQFFVEQPAGAQNVVITEINYNPYPPTAEELAAGFVDNDQFEFIELGNVSPNAVVLTGAALVDGVRFSFDAGTVRTLSPGESVVVAANRDAFAARYPAARDVAGQYDGQLDNGGEQIQLRDFFGNLIDSFSYDDAGNWPGRADGKGASLEPIDPGSVPVAEPDRAAFLSDGDNWRSSSQYGGSPGTAGSGPAGDVVVNEVLSNTPAPMLDAIELHNTTEAEIDVGGWYLSDSWGWAGDDANGNYKKYRIPDGRRIPPGGYLVFDERHFNPSAGADPQLHPDDFALSGDQGDDVWLMEADNDGVLLRFVDHVEFQAAAEGEPFGRWPNATGRMYPLESVTLGEDNGGPRVGPLIISELHYNPLPAGPLPDDPGDDLEFVEVYNPTSRTINLTEWRLRGGIDFDFPAGGQLAPYGTAVVVPFELTELGKLAAFYAAYWPGGPVPDDLLLLGGYSGQLDDDGERVQLQRPGAEVADVIPRLLEDEVRYYDVSPWPPSAGGHGDSLTRLATDAWGHAYQSWEARPPTPGQVPFPVPQAEVVGRHVFYNGSRFHALGGDDAAIAPDKQALLPGGTATFANYTGYSRGINGIIIDVAGLPEDAAPGVDDFQFHTGNDDDPAAWGTAPGPSQIAVRPGAGAEGSHRISILWPDNLIQKQWLRVTVLPGESTGLAAADVFYFGNAIGETGNSTTDAKVTAADMLGARDNQRHFLNPAPIDFAFDFDRDAKVNTVDVLIARNNQTHFLTALKLITVPGHEAKDALPGKVEKTTAFQQITRQAVYDSAYWLREYDEVDPAEEGGADDNAVDQVWTTYGP